MEKYIDFREIPELKMTDEERMQAFERFQSQLRPEQRKGRLPNLLKKNLLAVCAAALCIVVGGSVLAGAMNRGVFGKFLSSTFSKDPGKDIKKAEKTLENEEYRVTLENYYLDELGFGEFLFDIKNADGTPVSGEKKPEVWLTFQHEGEELQFWDHGESILYTKASDHGDEGTYSNTPEKGKILGGVLIGVNSPENLIQSYQDSLDSGYFDPEKDTLIFHYDGCAYPFDSIQVTSETVYQWNIGDGKVKMSNLGLITSGYSELYEYLKLDDGAYGPKGTVYYQDGSKEQIKIWGGYWADQEQETFTRFAPVTSIDKENYKALRDKKRAEKNGKKTDLEAESEWKEMTEDEMDQWLKELEYMSTNYYFDLDKLDRIEFGDIVLKTADAKKNP